MLGAGWSFGKIKTPLVRKYLQKAVIKKKKKKQVQVVWQFGFLIH